MDDIVSCIAGVQCVVAAAAINSFYFSGRLVDFEITLSLHDYSVDAFSAAYDGVFSVSVNDIVSFAAAQFIGASPAGNVIVSAAAIQHIVPAFPSQYIVAITTVKLVITCSTTDIIITGSSIDDIIA